MARPRDEEKRVAILHAAIAVIAERGLAATPTLAISKQAGVAEGTLFTYFRTKQDLANALYLHLKEQMVQAMSAGKPTEPSLRGVMERHWNGFVRWGVGHPQALAVMHQLASSGLLHPETIAEGSAPFADFEQMVRLALRSGEIRKIPFPLLTGTFEAMAHMTVRQILAGSGGPSQLRRIGFEMVWRAVAAHAE